MCTAGQRVSLTVTGPGPSFFSIDSHRRDHNAPMAFLLENGYFLKNKFFFNYFFLLYVLFGPKKTQSLGFKKKF